MMRSTLRPAILAASMLSLPALATAAPYDRAEGAGAGRAQAPGRAMVAAPRGGRMASPSRATLSSRMATSRMDGREGGYRDAGRGGRGDGRGYALGAVGAGLAAGAVAGAAYGGYGYPQAGYAEGYDGQGYAQGGVDPSYGYAEAPAAPDGVSGTEVGYPPPDGSYDAGPSSALRAAPYGGPLPQGTVPLGGALRESTVAGEVLAGGSEVAPDGDLTPLGYLRYPSLGYEGAYGGYGGRFGYANAYGFGF